MAGDKDLEADIDKLHAGAPEDFVKARGELAKRLTKEKRKAEAAEVKKLRKPSAAAAVVNELSRDNAKEMKALVAAGEKLRDPATVSDQKRLRAAVAKERESVEALMDAARSIGGSGATLERVGETLRAVVSDLELAEMVQAGRLDSEREASTIGFELALMPPTETKGRKKAKAGKSKDAKKAEAAAKKLEQAKLERFEKDLQAAKKREEEAEARLEVAENQLERARESVKKAKVDAKKAQSEVNEQRKRAK